MQNEEHSAICDAESAETRRYELIISRCGRDSLVSAGLKQGAAKGRLQHVMMVLEQITHCLWNFARHDWVAASDVRRKGQKCKKLLVVGFSIRPEQCSQGLEVSKPLYHFVFICLGLPFGKILQCQQCMPYLAACAGRRGHTSQFKRRVVWLLARACTASRLLAGS
eukprot:693457-Pleurochrysis_carterae.AAC.3